VLRARSSSTYRPCFICPATPLAIASATQSGMIVHPDTLLRPWQALVKVAGVTPIGLHGARHSYATLALEAGVRLDVVSRQLGHASIATTGNIYAHDSDEAATEAAARIGKVLGGGQA
jgi:integrase